MCIFSHYFEVGKLILFEQTTFLTRRILVRTGINYNMNCSVKITGGGCIYICLSKLYSHFTKLACKLMSRSYIATACYFRYS
jgi:hypothetical protein